MAKGIAVKVFSELDLAGVAAAVAQMKSIWGKAGSDINAAMRGQAGDLRALQDEMINSTNRAARAQIAAERDAGRAIIAERKARNAALIDEDKRTVAQQALVNRSLLAKRTSDQSTKEAADAKDRETRATDDHTDAMERNAAAAGFMGGALNKVGMAATGATALVAASTGQIAGNWEQMMTRIQVAGMVPTKEIGNLSQSLLQLSTSMGVSQQNIAQASLMLAKAGPEYKDAADQVSILRAAIELSKTEGADLTTTVQQLTTSLTDFSIKGAEAANVAAQIQVAASDAKRPLEEFLGAFHTVEPRAAAILDNKTGFQQVLTFMGRGASTGASMDQVGQNLINFMEHLSDPNNPQSAIIGSLGLDSNKLSEQLKQPNGMINVLTQVRQALMGVTDSQGIAHLGTGFRNPQLAGIMKTEYAGLNPQQRQMADALLRANEEGRELDPAQFKFLRAAKASGGMFPAWYQNYLKMTGPSQLMKQGIEPDISQARLSNKFFGTDSGFQTVQGIWGDLTNPNDQRWRDTLSRYQQVGGAKADAKGDLPGWAQVMDTFNQKLSEMKASLEQLGQKVGADFLPHLKKIVDGLSTFFDLISRHQGTLNVLVHGMEMLAEVWASQKLLGGLTSLVGTLGRLRNISPLAASSVGAVARNLEQVGPAGARAGEGLARTSTSLLNMIPVIGAIADSIFQVSEMVNKENNPRNREDQGMGHELFGKLWDWTFGSPPKPKPKMPEMPGATPWGTGHPDWKSPWFSTPTSTTDESGALTPGDSADLPDAGGGKKGKRSPLPGITSPDQIVMPDGTKDDPLYVNPADGFSGLMGGGGDNPLNKFTGTASGLWGKEGVLGKLAGLMTTFLANLALGNPIGFAQTGQMSPYAWWYQGPGAGGRGGLEHGFGKAEQASLRVANAFDRVNEALARGYGPGTPQYDIAARNYESAKIGAARAGASGFSGGGGGGPVISGAGPGGYSQDQAATAIISEARARGLNKEQTLAALSVGLLETNLGSNTHTNDSQNQSGTVVQGLFQQDSSYNKYFGGGPRTDPTGAARGYIDQFVARGGMNKDPYQGAVDVQVGDYGSGYVRSFRDRAEQFYNRDSYWAGAGGPGGLTPGPGRGGPSAGFDSNTFFNAPIDSPTITVNNPPSPFGFQPPMDTSGPPAPFGFQPPMDTGGHPGIGGSMRGRGGGADWLGGALGGTNGPGIGRAAGQPGFFGAGRGDSTVNKSKGGFETGASKPGFSLPILQTLGSAAGMGADMFAPGSGAAIQLAMQEANRAAQAAGEAAAVMVGEFPIETLGLTGKDLSGKNANLAESFPGKLLGGFMGAHGNTPNIAGPQGGEQDDKSKINKTNPSLKDKDTFGGLDKDMGKGNNYGVQTGDVHMHSGEGVSELQKGLQQGMMAAPGGGAVSPRW